MASFRGCGGGRRKLLSKALLVTFCLLLMVAAVAPSAVQEISADELVALQEIARTLNGMVTNWSWIKVSMFGIGGTVVLAILTMFTGVGTQYFVDRWRKTMAQWNSRMPPTLKDEFTSFTQQLFARYPNLKDLLARALNLMAALLEWMKNARASYAHKVARLRPLLTAAVDRLATEWDRMVAALNQLAAAVGWMAEALIRLAEALGQMTTALNRLAEVLDRLAKAITERKDEETNRKGNWDGTCSEPYNKNNSDYLISPSVETKPEIEPEIREGSSN